MACERQWQAVLDAIEEHGRGSVEHHAALIRWWSCRSEELKPPEPDTRADERMMEQWEYWRKLWASIRAKIDIPPSPVFENRCIEVRKKIFADVETAMIFSKSIEQAFQESGIQLEDDETFACFVYVRKKPTDVSEVVLPSFPGLHSPLCIIMEPGTMQQIMADLPKFLEAIEPG